MILFQVIDEFGLAHKRVFVTRCTVGDITCEGRGNKKSSSKQNVAKLMLLELAKLGPLPMRYRIHAGYGYSQKRSSRVIKVPTV